MSRLPIVLAGDIGGTKTLLGLFDASAKRPAPLVVRSFSTLDHPDLATIVKLFLEGAGSMKTAVRCACFGAAGPVVDNATTLTNVDRRIDGAEIGRALDIPRVIVLNDLLAMVYGVPELERGELCVLQEGEPGRGGNMGLLAAGTGLGEALLHAVDGGYIPSATESGHADFPARTEREIDVLRDLTSRLGRASVEQVVSGMGLLNLHRVAHAGAQGPCLALRGDAYDNPDAAAIISTAGLERTCRGCVETLGLFVDAYGAEAGNLALRTLSTGGIFIGGGIAPKILPALTDGRFMRAFVEKAPFDRLLRTIPVSVILNTQAGLFGAAVYAGYDERGGRAPQPRSGA